MRGLLLIAGVLATSQPAWAKYDPCGHISVLEPASPVPRNAKIWMWRSGGEGGERLRIRGPDLDRRLAPPVLGSSRGLAALDPGLLGRDEAYRIAIVGDGYAWTLGELATGSEIDLLPPRPPRFHALAITQRIDPRDPDALGGGGGFDDFDGFDVPASDIATALDLSDDTVALDVAFDDSTEHFITPREAPSVFSRNRCWPGRRFPVGARICMSIRAIDLAGNRGDAAVRCTTIGGRTGDTSRTARAHAWPARRDRPWDRPGGPDGWLALAAVAVWVSYRLASRRLPEAHGVA